MVELVVNNDKATGEVVPFKKPAPKKKAPAKKKSAKRQAQETAARIGALADKFHGYCETLSASDLKDLQHWLTPLAHLMAKLDANFELTEGAPTNG